MLKSKSHRIVTAALFAAVGLILPYFTSHAFGVPGTILLPMHLPILLCGLLCGPQLGAVCALIVPALSSILTGMPPAYPMLPIMAVQLLVMGILSGLLYQRLKLHIYLALPASMAAGWAAYGLMYAVLLLGNGELKALSVTAALVQGIPGMAAQLALIPAIVVLLNKTIGKTARKKREIPMGAKHEETLADAVALIKNEKISCVVIRDGAIVHTADGRGVSPLLRLYDGDPDLLKDAFVVDKIIGKAAAMILTLGGARKVYGEIMSVAAEKYLTERGIEAVYGRCVDVISNREKNGICPIERSVIDIDDPQEGLTHIKATVTRLMKNAV